MNTLDISTAKDPDLRASINAMQRAAALARKTAIQTDTHLVIMEGEKLVRLSADELRRIDSQQPLRGALKDYADCPLSRVPRNRRHGKKRQTIAKVFNQPTHTPLGMQ